MTARPCLIRVQALRENLANVKVVDCSHDLEAPEAGAQAYAHGHIPTAVHAHLDRDLSGAKTGSNGRHPLPEVDAFVRWLGASGIGADDTVVAYDRSGGMYAARLWWLLRWIGHRDVQVLDGGWQAWVAEGGASDTTPAASTATRYEGARPSDAMRVDADFVLRNLADGHALVVDARGAPRYAGVIEPIDARAGHIPGAVNRPFTDNLDADGRFKSADVLAGEWVQVLGAHAGTDIVAQCGSGVTACHNLLAMEVAGLPPARLYPGSWSEWSSDPQRPIATGATPR